MSFSNIGLKSLLKQITKAVPEDFRPVDAVPEQGAADQLAFELDRMSEISGISNWN